MFLNWCFSSIREINRLKRKGKCVLLFNVFNGCYTVINSLISKGMSNITIEKNVERLKRRFSRKENLKKCSSFERAKRYKIYSRKSLLRHYRLQLSFVYKTVFQIYSNLFCSGDKSLLSEFLRKWGWFHGHNERFTKYLAKKLKFQKTETRFCRWKSTDNNDINIFLSLKNPCTFLLVKEKIWKSIFNTNSELLQNRTEKQIMPFKTTINWLFNDIWCYLVIGSFDWIIGVFQQTVVRVYP